MKRQRSLRRISIMVLALFILSSAAAYAVEPPLFAVSKALANFADEIGVRACASPFGAIGTLLETLNSGTVTVDFNYSDEYTDEVSGEVVLKSDADNMEYQVGVTASTEGEEFEFDLVMNRDRLAFKTPQLSDDYYGVTYGTFADDIAAIEHDVLDDATIDQLIQLVEMLDSLMNPTEVPDIVATEVYGEEYADLLYNFIKDLEVVTARQTVLVGGAAVSCTKVEYNITEDDIIGLMNDLLELLKADEMIPALIEAVSAYLDAINAGYSYTPEYLTYEEFVELYELYEIPAEEEQEIRDVYEMIYGGMEPPTEAPEPVSAIDAFVSGYQEAVEAFAESYDGTISFKFYITESDRLLRMDAVADIAIDGEGGVIEFIIDTGTSVTDRWAFSFNTISSDDYYDDYYTKYEIEWLYGIDADEHLQTMTFSSVSGDKFDFSGEASIFTSTWSADTGAFTLAYEDWWDYTEVTGTYSPAGDGFYFKFDNLGDDYYEEVFSLEISTTSDVEIGSPDYLGVEDWAHTALDYIESMQSRYDYSYDDYEPYDYTPTATPSVTTVLIDGEAVEFYTYEIYGETYFKLRDIAYALNGTDAQFNVDWDNKYKFVIAELGNPYIGSEMQPNDGEVKTPEYNYSRILYSEVSGNYQSGSFAYLYPYKIDGCNYVMLDDLSWKIGYSVMWDEETGVHLISTASAYEW